MRTIKFRAWVVKDEFDEDSKSEMVYDVQKEYDGYIADSFGGILADHDRFKVMQFTGLLDKNGKEIYEGDIVRYIEYNQVINSTVYYHGGDVGYGCYIPFGDDMESCMGSDVEVIGNIHDNPELTK